jgi:hypothetical protein
MFRTDLLSIIRSLNTALTAIGICHTSDVACLLAGLDITTDKTSDISECSEQI